MESLDAEEEIAQLGPIEQAIVKAVKLVQEADHTLTVALVTVDTSDPQKLRHVRVIVQGPDGNDTDCTLAAAILGAASEIIATMPPLISGSDPDPNEPRH